MLPGMIESKESKFGSLKDFDDIEFVFNFCIDGIILEDR
jgi:hypothetical protein